MEVTKDSFKQISYWKPTLDSELKLRDEAEYAEEFQEIFTRSVRVRAQSSYPLGVMLSGDLDSSAITSIASKILPIDHTLHAFCNVLSPDYTGNAKNEREFIELLRNPNLNINYLSNPTTGPFDGLVDLLNKVESPNYISQQYIHREFADLMHKKTYELYLMVYMEKWNHLVLGMVTSPTYSSVVNYGHYCNNLMKYHKLSVQIGSTQF